ncbi:endonuclease domain-containing protein [Dickeya zeae]|uniref:DUF559 domain-containing protein n=1 Tax=Dickeya zeae TaxID=204042 RepID=UPI001CF98748|nr:DUF559 domain-containing protein [Dickeya zeae]UCZ76777.1 endonuclease domain-containing protein [Dickeya zeae]
MENYLTERNLGEILKKISPHLDFVHNKSVPNSKNRRHRPDYRCDSAKLIIEFDGDTHYCKAQRIITDMEKDEDYRLLGYRIFRIPYFVQITDKVISHMLGFSMEFKQVYPNGFIDAAAVLPADFCELGIARFISDLETFYYHKCEILYSLKENINNKGDVNLVLPPSLHYLLL